MYLNEILYSTFSKGLQYSLNQRRVTLRVNLSNNFITRLACLVFSSKKQGPNSLGLTPQLHPPSSLVVLTSTANALSHSKDVLSPLSINSISGRLMAETLTFPNNPLTSEPSLISDTSRGVARTYVTSLRVGRPCQKNFPPA